MRSLSLLLLMLLGLGTTLSAQTANRIEGRVVDDAGEPLSQVMVVLIDKEESPLVYCTTGMDGAFSLALSSGVRSKAESLSFRLLGLETVVIPLSKWSHGQTVVMRDAPIELHEVRVQARPIRRAGDTLTYVTSGFRQKQDRTIADVIAKMPGLEVLPTGVIKYQGKSINKLYIEGMDLLGPAYAQASENLDARKVKSVQVLTNHQPIQALRNVTFSDQAALNIVLTDDAKSVWQAVIDAGLGTPVQGSAALLRDARLMGMLFEHKRQNLSLLKSNNVGKDIKYEIMDLVRQEDAVYGSGRLLSPIELGVSGLDRRRYRHNDSHLATTNQLFRTPLGNDLRIRLHGMYDLSRVRQRDETRYLLAVEQPTVAEELEADNRDIECKAEVKYEVNKPALFLNSTLAGYSDWLRSLGRTVVNGISQSPEVHSRNSWIGHHLRLVKGVGQDRLTLSSDLLLARNPGRLLLLDGAVEHLSIDRAGWTANGSWSHRFGPIQSEWEAGLQLVDQRLRRILGEEPLADRYRMWRAYVSPTLRIDGLDWRTWLSLPATLLGQRMGDLSEPVRPLFTPSAMAEWTPTGMLRLSIHGGYSVSTRGFLASTALPYYSSYLLLAEGPGRPGLTRSLSTGGIVRYEDSMRSLFAHMQLIYMRRWGDLLYKRALKGPVYHRIATDRTGGSDLLLVGGRVSKGFGWGLFTAALSGDYSRQSYQLLVGEEVRPFLSHMGTLHLEAYYHPLESLSVELDSSGSLSRVAPPEGMTGTQLLSFYHTLKVYYMPGRWELKWESELFHSPDKSVTRSFFTDLSLAYRADRWEAGLECRNLAGTTSYGRRVIGPESEYASMTLLRPRELMLRLSFSL